MRLVERVPRERLDQVEQLLRQPLLVAVRDRPRHEALALGQHHRGDLLPHRLPHHVGLAQRVAREVPRDLQHLVLVRDHPVRLVQHPRQVGVRVARLGAPVLHVDVARDMLHGPRPVERDHRRQLADVTRLQLLHPAPHPPTLELEHTEGAPLGEQLGRRLVAVGDRLEVEPARDQLGRLTEDRQVRQPEEVELQQPDPRDVVHVELRRRQRLRVFVLARRRPLQRHQVGQRLARDHHARRVRARVPRHALQAARRLDQLAHLRIVRRTPSAALRPRSAPDRASPPACSAPAAPPGRRRRSSSPARAPCRGSRPSARASRRSRSARPDPARSAPPRSGSPPRGGRPRSRSPRPASRAARGSGTARTPAGTALARCP